MSTTSPAITDNYLRAILIVSLVAGGVAGWISSEQDGTYEQAAVIGVMIFAAIKAPALWIPVLTSNKGSKALQSIQDWLERTTAMAACTFAPVFAAFSGDWSVFAVVLGTIVLLGLIAYVADR